MKTKLLHIAMLAVLVMAAMTTGQAQDVPITLEQGWNWISYPRSEPMTIEAALSGFTPAEGDILKSQTSMAQYQNGSWSGNLTTLIPGEGYMYQSADGTVKSFIFGGTANDPSGLPEEALSGEFKVASNGTKVRFSPGNLQCRVDPNQESQATVGTGTSTTGYMPYNTYYKYSLCQMIYKAEELYAAGLGPGSITSLAFESYSSYHYLRNGITVWMAHTMLTEAPSTSVSTSGMTQVFSGSLIQQDGWTPIYFGTPFTWDGASNLMVTVVMNHGSYNSSTYWRCSSSGFTRCNYRYTDGGDYDPSSTTYSMYTTTSRPNTRFDGKGGVTWRFAEKQWDYIGEGNTNVSSSYTGWIDLFGWGTSGHPHGAVYYQPWSTGTGSSNYYAYGGESYNLFDQTGEADWGCNAISNGGGKPNQWRTLTSEEWDYMLNTRSGKRYAKAQVAGVNGLIVLPDGWKTSYYSLSNTNTADAAFSSNTITADQWQTLEQHGAVFLPAAGNRYMGINYAGSKGYYWTSSCNNSNAYYIVFYNSNVIQSSDVRCAGLSVRLVCQSNPRIRTLGVSNLTTNSATVSAEVDHTGSVGARGICWSTMAAPTYDDNHASAGSGKGGFSAQLSGLESNTTYHVRAFAKISSVYRYGNELTFTTGSSLSVSTSYVTGVTGTFAQCGGTVTGGGQGITARGVCWNASGEPTLSDSHTCDGRGEGTFSSMMDNLTAGTYYYVRAYATTAEGTVYGNQRGFTASDMVEVTTAAVSNVTTATATCGGMVDNHGGSNAVTARGVCWGTSSSPTVSGSHTTDGTGTGNFTSQLTGLTPGTTYYVRAYATTSEGTTYGSQQSFTTTAPTGAINGLFSVSATQKVFFSQGNLQYKASTNTWRFATNQYDYIGSNNANASSTYSGYIDLFGWGTSGYNHGAVCYQPWSTSQTTSDYYAYGSATYNLYDQTGKADWGYNPISNGGNTANQWRTLTQPEWAYVFNTRNTTSGIRYAKAKVNNVNGVILLPDNWSSSTYSLSNTNTSSASFSSNTISSSQWTTFENAGAVFLPAAGYRYGTSVYDVGSRGYYWSASYNNSLSAYGVYFYDDSLGTYDSYRCYGFSVRLVRVAE